MTPLRRPHIGFVLERSLGHITHADNLRRNLATEDAIDADVAEVEWETTGLMAKVPVFNSNWTVRSGLRARRLIRRMHRAHRLDALFVHTQVPAVLVPDWVSRVPTVVSLDATPLQYDELGSQYGHEVGGGRVEQLKWRANRACFQRSRHIVAWSAWAKDGVVDGYGIDPDKISIIAPGVTPSVWYPPSPRATPAASGDQTVRILFVGGDLERKGGDILLKAFAELRAEMAATPDLTLELHMVTGAVVSDQPGVVVHRDLKPNSAALIELYHRADIFCLPTRGDCLPMVLSEAGAAELPLVSTSVAGIPEIVKDGETGLVVAVDDVASLVHALRTLVEQPQLRSLLGTAARGLVDVQFDAVKNTRQLVELLVQTASNQA